MNTIETRLEEMLGRAQNPLLILQTDVPKLVQALRRAICVLQAVPPPNPFWREADGALADIAKILTEGKE